MNQLLFTEVLNAFAGDPAAFDVQYISGGLINESYLATCTKTGNSFLIQQINDAILTDPVLVQENYINIWEYFNDNKIDFFLPEPKRFPGGLTLFPDKENNFWRIYSYVPNTVTYSTPQTPEQAWHTASTFGKFTASLDHFEFDGLNITIPHFHNLTSRYNQFENSLKAPAYSRLELSAALILELKNRYKYVNMYEVFTESSEFHERVMHHDAKIGNVLFDKTSGYPVCPVDFDTIMPGYFFSDLGDLVRSMAGTTDENEKDTRQVSVKKEIYEQIIDGYLSHMGNKLTTAERNYIHHAGLLIIYMQALRFATDFLNEDAYYKINYPEHNLHRAENQLALLKSLEDFLQREYHYTVL